GRAEARQAPGPERTVSRNSAARSVHTDRAACSGARRAWDDARVNNTAVNAASSASSGAPRTTRTSDGASGMNGSSQGDVAVFFGGQAGAFVAQHPKRPGDVTPGVGRRDHRVDIATLRGHIRV